MFFISIGYVLDLIILVSYNLTFLKICIKNKCVVSCVRGSSSIGATKGGGDCWGSNVWGAAGTPAPDAAMWGLWGNNATSPAGVPQPFTAGTEQQQHQMQQETNGSKDAGQEMQQRKLSTDSQTGSCDTGASNPVHINTTNVTHNNISNTVPNTSNNVQHMQYQPQPQQQPYHPQQPQPQYQQHYHHFQQPDASSAAGAGTVASTATPPPSSSNMATPAAATAGSTQGSLFGIIAKGFF